MKRGYARVSTLEQDLGRQIQALQQYGCEKIYQDKVSGTKTTRDGLDAMIADIQPGDVVTVQKIDRLCRSMRHLLTLIDKFEEKGATFISLTENFDNSTAIGKMMIQMIGAFAELERNMISERTINALKHKKSIGVVLGKPGLTAATIQAVNDLYLEGKSQADIARQLGISSKSVFRIVNKKHSTNKNNCIDLQTLT